MAKYPAVIYRPTPQKQKATLNGVLIGCTETSFAMLVDAVTFGGCLVTEAIVRELSGEVPPDPQSPGLNLDQLVKVAKKLHVEFTNETGKDWGQFVALLNENRRAVAQLWYSLIGGGNIGHAVHVQAIRQHEGRTQALINDPMKLTVRWLPVTELRAAMEEFANRTNVPGDGLRFGVSAKTVKMALGAS